jgi:hypothetical protein
MLRLILLLPPLSEVDALRPRGCDNGSDAPPAVRLLLLLVVLWLLLATSKLGFREERRKAR